MRSLLHSKAKAERLPNVTAHQGLGLHFSEHLTLSSWAVFSGLFMYSEPTVCLSISAC